MKRGCARVTLRVKVGRSGIPPAPEGSSHGCTGQGSRRISCRGHRVQRPLHRSPARDARHRHPNRRCRHAAHQLRTRSAFSRDTHLQHWRWPSPDLVGGPTCAREARGGVGGIHAAPGDGRAASLTSSPEGRRLPVFMRGRDAVAPGGRRVAPSGTAGARCLRIAMTMRRGPATWSSGSAPRRSARGPRQTRGAGTFRSGLRYVNCSSVNSSCLVCCMCSTSPVAVMARNPGSGHVAWTP